MVRTAWIYFHPMIDLLKGSGGGAKLPMDFYRTERWAARANSTDRLTVTNYQSLQMLGDDHDVDLIPHSDALDRLDELLGEYDNVVVNLIASPKAAAFVRALAASEAYPRRRARLVFGTEMTPFSEVSRGNLGAREIEMLYFENLLLRHTARTDVPVYASPDATRARILEFPLAVDTHLLRPNPQSERRYITFVKAPPNRLTKNNGGVDEIAALLTTYRRFYDLEVRIVEPPYTSVELWSIFEQSAYLIFTSVGETFSYVVNDAMSHGVVCFIRGEMFAPRIPGFTADSYADHGLRYGSQRDLLRQLDALVLDPERWSLESARARQSVERRFSVPALAQAWDMVLRGDRVPRRTMLILDGRERGADRAEVARLASAAGASVVMFDRNRGWSARPNGAYSEHFAEEDVTLVRNYLSEIDGELWRYDRAASRGRIVSVENREETVGHLCLVCRLNEVTDIALDASLEGTGIADAARAWVNSADPFGMFDRKVSMIELAKIGTRA